MDLFHKAIERSQYPMSLYKCNSDNIRGGAPSHMAYYCAHSQAGLMVTRREIAALRPRKIVSIAGSAYNPYVGAHWGLDPRLILLLPHPAGHVSYAALAQRAKEFVLGSAAAELDRPI
jgi:hypothetical protein